jgi:hypothetical protein
MRVRALSSGSRAPRNALPSIAIDITVFEELGHIGKYLTEGRIECLRVDDPEDLRKGIMRWNGMLEFQEILEKLSFARLNAAISAQEVDPHKTDTKAITSNSPRSWRTLLARGSGTSSKADRKICMAMSTR